VLDLVSNVHWTYGVNQPAFHKFVFVRGTCIGQRRRVFGVVVRLNLPFVLPDDDHTYFALSLSLSLSRGVSYRLLVLPMM